MFDHLVSAAGTARNGAAVAGWARVEAAACARRLAAMAGILDARHAADGSAEREQWCLDNWGAVCAQIGAAQQITSGAASDQLLVAVALRDRLPLVGAAFAEGCGTYRLIKTIVWRTALIKDPAALAAVDAALAAALRGWEPRSEAKMVTFIDALIDRHDPHAVRRTQTAARSRHLEVTIDDAAGTATVWGSLFAHDAKAFDARLDTLARTVCEHDPRTLDQRRADATGVVAVHGDRLACLCGTPDCPAAGAAPASAVVVHVVVNADTLTEDSAAAVAQDAALDRDEPRPPSTTPSGEQAPAEETAARPCSTPLRDQTLAEALADNRPAEWAATRPGAILGGPVIAGAITRRIALTAKVQQIFFPGNAPPEPRYRPSAKLAEFIRCRDMTCRFPGCDEPSMNCDIDHTIAHPGGPTQASNLKCLCRFHHLLKTFWAGPSGWRDRQLFDGTVIWTDPDGLTHTTRPGSLLLFPALCQPTAPVDPAVVTAHADTTPATGLTMPHRKATRAADRHRRIDDERRENEEAQRNSSAEASIQSDSQDSGGSSSNSPGINQS